MNSPNPTESRRLRVIAGLAVVVVALAVHAPTVRYHFAFDDGPEVVDNAFLRSLRDAPAVFTTPSWAGSGTGREVPMWRPLTTLSYAVNYAAGGLDPSGYHAANVVLNAVVSLLVMVLALQLGVSTGGALVAGLLFAVLPVHVEAVANVAGRKDLLVTAFALGAVLAHRSALRRGGAALLVAPACVAGALLSKESGMAVLGVLVAHDVLFRPPDGNPARRRLVGLYAAYAVLVAGFVLGRHAVLGTLVFPGSNFEENPVTGAPVGVRLMTAVAVLGRGLALLVAPVTLSPDYSFAAIPRVTSPLDPAFLLSLGALLVLSAAVAWAFRRYPLGAFAAAWYAITLFPASNLAVPIGTIFGERLLYTPSVGVALLAGAAAGAALATRARVVAGVAVAAVLAAYAGRTLAYAPAWRDDLSVFEAAVRGQPESAKAHRMLGGQLVEAGRLEEARREFERAIEILDRRGGGQGPPAGALVELGVAYEKLGRLPDAERLFLRVLATDPANADALWRLGVVRWQEGRRPEGVALWEQAVAASPGHARALNDLGIAAYVAGNLPGAERAWRRATEADPRLASAWYRLGNLLERNGDAAGAREAWTRFLDTAHERFPEQRAEVARKLGTTPSPR